MTRRRRSSPARSARREQRRAELLTAADRVIRRDGPAASMQQIAEEAGITKPVLYRHFGDKGGLYAALAERYASAVMERVATALHGEADSRRRLAVTIDTYLAFIQRETPAYRFLTERAIAERPEAQATVVGFTRRIAGEVAAVLADELDAAGRDQQAAAPWAHAIVGMVQAAGDWWLEQQTLARARLVDYLVALLWDGLSANPDATAAASRR